jgi:flagellar FliJ protein
MKRFQFPLRPVAVIRAHHELRAREALAASIRAYTESAEKLAGARARVAELESVLFASRRESMRASDEAAFFQAYRRECASEMESLRLFIASRDSMERSREEFLEARRRVKTVDRLEQRARETYRLESLRAEQGEIDEIAGRRPVLREVSP